MEEDLSEVADNSSRNNKLTLLEAYKRLSRRECEILENIKDGKSADQISKHLCISKSTVENHITNIGRRLKQKGKGKLRKWISSES